MQQNEALQPIGIEEIKNKIFEIRGTKVMIDRDLAELYQVETRTLNQAVKRNIERFPKDFMFQLTATEWEIMSSQFVTTSQKKRPKSSLPFVFTEYGVVMLVSILRSNIAITMSVFITRAFVDIRQSYLSYLNQNLQIEKISHQLNNLSNYVDDILHDQNDINEDTAVQLELINQTLAELKNNQIQQEKFKNRKPIGFKVDK